MDELSKRIENLNNKKQEIPIIEDILSKNNVTTGNENSIRWKVDEVILEYAKQNYKNEVMYFVQDDKKIYWSNNEKHYNRNVYSILKVENNKIQEMAIDKENMPKNIGVNDVYTIKDGEIVANEFATKEIKKEITNMAEEIINKQNIELNNHRKEGHLYMVKEKVGRNLFLWNLTEKPEFEFEEINLQKDLFDKVEEGSVLIYNDGCYKYYSNNGYEMEKKI